MNEMKHFNRIRIVNPLTNNSNDILCQTSLSFLRLLFSDCKLVLRLTIQTFSCNADKIVRFLEIHCLVMVSLSVEIIFTMNTET